MVDTKPRQWTPHSCQILANFAELAIRAIERAVAFSVSATKPMLQFAVRSIHALDTCVVVVDAGKPGLPVVYANQAAGVMLGG
jgi:hypothetical protein